MNTLSVPEQCRVWVELRLVQLTREAQPPASLDEAREFDWSAYQRQRERLERVARAKQHMDAGDYGVCAGCHQPIDPARLLAEPTTEFCICCQETEQRRIGRSTARRLHPTN